MNTVKYSDPKTAVSGRTFYKSVYRFEVLSEHPIGSVGLRDLAAMTSDGDCSGRFLKTAKSELNGRQAARALLAQGSDPSFFRLTSEGKDTDD